MQQGSRLTRRRFRLLLVLTLVVLTIQGWFGDTTNIFVVPATAVTPPQYSFAGFVSALQSLPITFVPLFHAFEGIFLIGLAVLVFGLSFPWSKARSVRVFTGLGLFMVASAALGGFMFVMSGFSNGGASAEMGGSFIGAYAFYFISLYYAG